MLRLISSDVGRACLKYQDIFCHINHHFLLLEYAGVYCKKTSKYCLINMQSDSITLLYMELLIGFARL